MGRTNQKVVEPPMVRQNCKVNDVCICTSNYYDCSKLTRFGIPTAPLYLYLGIHEIIGITEWRLIEPENIVGIIASVKVSYVCIERCGTGTSWRPEERHTEYAYLTVFIP